MARFIKLFTDFQKHPLYPKAVQYSEYEAWLDLLIVCHPTGVSKEEPQFFAERWTWEPDFVEMFMQQLEKMKLIDYKSGRIQILKSDLWYDEKEATQEKKNREAAKLKKEADAALVKSVIDCYNYVFSRNIETNPYRTRTILKRVSEGSTMTKPVGLEQFKMVFLVKKKEWENTDEAKFLTIETLCADKHFFKYLDQARLDWKKNNPNPIAR